MAANTYVLGTEVQSVSCISKIEIMMWIPSFIMIVGTPWVINRGRLTPALGYLCLNCHCGWPFGWKSALLDIWVQTNTHWADHKSWCERKGSKRKQTVLKAMPVHRFQPSRNRLVCKTCCITLYQYIDEGWALATVLNTNTNILN